MQGEKDYFTVINRLGPIKRKPKISNNEKRRLAKQRQLEEDQAKQATSPESNKTKTAWSGWYVHLYLTY